MKTEKIQKFFALPRAERVLLLRSLLLMGFIRAGLWGMSLPHLMKILATLYCQMSADNLDSTRSIAWAVTVTSRFIPRATCLVQGLTTLVLLAHAGIPSDLCIGVAKDDRASFEAHAWVETDGRIIIGGPQLDRYTRLTSFVLRAK